MLISLLIAIVIICVVIWAVKALIAAFGLPQPLATVIYVIVVLIVVVWALRYLGFGIL
jgi:hypothetical protein